MDKKVIQFEKKDDGLHGSITLIKHTFSEGSQISVNLAKGCPLSTERNIYTLSLIHPLHYNVDDQNAPTSVIMETTRLATLQADSMGNIRNSFWTFPPTPLGQKGDILCLETGGKRQCATFSS